jgi:hypothetical protein
MKLTSSRRPPLTMHLVVTVFAVLYGIALQVTALGSEGATLAEIPSQAEQVAAEKSFSKVYGDAVRHARVAKDDNPRLVLTNEFRETAGRSSRADAYVLYRHALSLASQCGDGAELIAILDEVDDTFAPPLWDIYSDVVDGLLNRDAPIVSQDIFFARVIRQIRLTCQSLAITHSVPLANKALALAHKWKREHAEKLLEAEKRVCVICESRYEDVSEVLTLLAKDGAAHIPPADSERAGLFLCFYLRKWTQGLPLLANGVDETIVHLASNDLNAERRRVFTDQGEEIAPADVARQWRDFLESAKSKQSDAVLLASVAQRATFWYRKAVLLAARDSLESKALLIDLAAIERDWRVDEETGSPSSAIALWGRTGGLREQRLIDNGGDEKTEEAVRRALAWLTKQQKNDGFWSLTGSYGDGGTQENRLAASAMALIAIQGAGNTTRDGPHAAAVTRAWKALVRTQAPDGTFDTGRIPEQHAMYAHAQATIALCEIYGMTKDPTFAEPARLALEYAIAAQMPDGGWRYHPPQPGQENRGDMSVTGWYLMALKSSEMAGLHVPSSAYDSLRRFLDSVFVSAEKGYGYQINPNQKFFDFRPALTAEGLMCHLQLGRDPKDPQIKVLSGLLLHEGAIDFDYRKKNVYSWFHTTGVFRRIGGRPWDLWNNRMKAELVGHQVADGKEAGSWDPANDQWGHVGGRLYTTCLCALMLESYYREAALPSLRIPSRSTD